MIGKLANLAVPPWVKLAVPAVLVALVFGAGMWAQRKFDSGTIERLKGRVLAQQYLIDNRNGVIIKLRDEAAHTIQVLADNHAAKLQAEADLAAYLAQPPRTITRWRDRADNVETELPTGRPCEETVLRAVKVLQRSLAERGEGGR
jgi:hypothetical protein